MPTCTRLGPPPPLPTGVEFDDLPGGQQGDAVAGALSVFARVEPSHKTRLVELLKAQVRAAAVAVRAGRCGGVPGAGRRPQMSACVPSPSHAFFADLPASLGWHLHAHASPFVLPPPLPTVTLAPPRRAQWWP
jgi:hypothetical protein